MSNVLLVAFPVLILVGSISLCVSTAIFVGKALRGKRDLYAQRSWVGGVLGWVGAIAAVALIPISLALLHT